MQRRMNYDDAAWEKSEEIADAWVRQFLEPDVLRSVGRFIVKHHNPDDPTAFDVLERGAFNVSLHMIYKNSSAVIRFSQPGTTLFPEEKVRNEVAIIRGKAGRVENFGFLTPQGTFLHSMLYIGQTLTSDS
jgi:hypothetical protein